MVIVLIQLCEIYCQWYKGGWCFGYTKVKYIGYTLRGDGVLDTLLWIIFGDMVKLSRTGPGGSSNK